MWGPGPFIGQGARRHISRAFCTRDCACDRRESRAVRRQRGVHRAEPGPIALRGSGRQLSDPPTSDDCPITAALSEGRIAMTPVIENGKQEKQTLEPHIGYGKTGQCCGECGSSLTSGDRPDRVPTGCGGAFVRLATSTGPQFNQHELRTVCTGDSAPAVSPASASTGLQEARRAATADAETPRFRCPTARNAPSISQFPVAETSGAKHARECPASSTSSKLIELSQISHCQVSGNHTGPQANEHIESDTCAGTPVVYTSGISRVSGLNPASKLSTS